MNKVIFAKRESIEQVEEGKVLAPKFDLNGIMPAVVTETSSGEVLMLGYMNEDSLRKTIETKEAYYWSRSREVLWKKGDSSGMIHEVDEILIDPIKFSNDVFVARAFKPLKIILELIHSKATNWIKIFIFLK